MGFCSAVVAENTRNNPVMRCAVACMLQPVGWLRTCPCSPSQILDSTGWYEALSSDVDFHFAERQLARHLRDKDQGRSVSFEVRLNSPRTEIRELLGKLRGQLSPDDQLGVRKVWRGARLCIGDWRAQGIVHDWAELKVVVLRVMRLRRRRPVEGGEEVTELSSTPGVKAITMAPDTWSAVDPDRAKLHRRMVAINRWRVAVTVGSSGVGVGADESAS